MYDPFPPTGDEFSAGGCSAPTSRRFERCVAIPTQWLSNTEAYTTSLPETDSWTYWLAIG